MDTDFAPLTARPKGDSKRWHVTLVLLQLAAITLLIFMLLQHTLETKPLTQSIHDHVEKMADHSTYFPKSHIISNVNPVLNQAQRGTCWDFSTVAVLEHAYRKHGLEQGWLDENQYVDLSEQAYGLTIVDFCTANPERCPITAQGADPPQVSDGYVYWLYYFRSYIQDKILPAAICPYQPTEAGQLVCDGYEEALKTNPVSFTVNGMRSLYDFESIKRDLLDNDMMLSFSTPILGYRTKYVPCENGFQTVCTANPDSVVTCPSYIQGSTNCLTYSASARSDDGIFLAIDADAEDIILSGGHAMDVVGYRDNFPMRTHNAMAVEEDILILRNSWAASKSHSMEFLSGEISSWDELAVCPNWDAPHQWFMCDNYTMLSTWELPDYWDGPRAETAKLTPKDWIADAFEADTFYCIKRIERDRAETDVIVLVPYDDHEGTEIVLNEVDITDLSRFFTLNNSADFPQNSEDHCGFYVFPRSYYKHASPYSGLWALSFDIEYNKCSYYANRMHSDCKKYDYELLKESLFTQEPLSEDVSFGPVPWQPAN